MAGPSLMVEAEWCLELRVGWVQWRAVSFLVVKIVVFGGLGGL